MQIATLVPVIACLAGAAFATTLALFALAHTGH